MELTVKNYAIQEEEQITSILTEVIPPSDEQSLVLLAKA